MPNDRDTKFREGFAQLLLEDIEPDLFDIAIHNDPDGAKQRIKDKFAQRAYDLIAHTLHESGIDKDAPFNDATMPTDIPDLTQWPEPPPFLSDFLTALPDFLTAIETSNDQLP